MKLEKEETPFEYHNQKLGVKIKFLINDRDKHPESLNLISYNALYKRIKSSTCSEKELRKGSWNNNALILFTSLPQDLRDQLTIKFGKPEEEVKKSWFSENYISDRQAFDFFASYTYDEGKKLDTDHIQLYTYNASVLNTVLLMKNNRQQYLKSLGCKTVDIWSSLSRDVNAFRDVPHNLPTTRNSLERKAREYKANGYVSIISGKHMTKNAAKVKDDEQMALIDELLGKHQNLEYTTIAEIYNSIAVRLQWPKITAKTIGNRHEKSNLVVYAGRKGSTALSNKILMQNKRSAPTKPMLYWTLDGWDTELLYQKTDISKQGYSTTTYHNRLTMVTVLDPFNKYIIGYAIGTHETPELIKEALRNAFLHVKELFGAFYRPYQLQSDNYAKSALKSTYEAVSVHYTPAKVKNAKSKVIEPFFNQFNKKYLKLYENWSGHNINSGSKNQPNSEYLNKISKSFPDENGCRQQLIAAVEADREKKREQYQQQWENVSQEHKSELSQSIYLKYLGSCTGFTNKLQPGGLPVTINNNTLIFDSFDLNFRKLSHVDWAAMYDPNDTSQVLVTNAKSRNGKLQEIIGTYEFMLQQKYVQPMALAEREEGDALKLIEVKNYNSSITKYITGERENNIKILETLFSNPALEDTLGKHLLVDSRGQHKDRKSEARLKQVARQLVEVEKNTASIETSKNWAEEINEYNQSRTNINDYL